MPAGRILLKAISESKKLSMLKTDGARLLYTWLIPHVDVNGCFSGDPDVIRGQVFTRLKKTDRDIETYLEDMISNRLVVRYQSNGDVYIFLPSFEEKQPHLNRDREATPRIPLPTQDQLQSLSGPNPDKIPLNLKSKFKSKFKSNVNKVETENNESDPKSEIQEGVPVSPVDEIILQWNAFAVECRLPEVKGITRGSKREINLRARMGEKGFDFHALLGACKQPFLLGDNKDGWTITFDWILCPSNYQKIIEGNYARNKGTGKLSGISEWLKGKENGNGK